MAYELALKSNTGASAWKQMEAWRAKRKAEREDFEANMATVTDMFSSIQTNNTQTLGTIAAQRALERIQAATAKKQAENAKAVSGTAENPSGFTVMESIAARYAELSIGAAVDVSV